MLKHQVIRSHNADSLSIVLRQFHTLRWRHNEHNGVSNHKLHDCLLNRLFRDKSTKTSKLRVTGLCAGNSSGTGEFPAQGASNAENVSISWRHHGKSYWGETIWEAKPYEIWPSCHRVKFYLSMAVPEKSINQVSPDVSREFEIIPWNVLITTVTS